MWERSYLNQLVEGNHIYLNRDFNKKVDNVFALVINEDGVQNLMEKIFVFYSKTQTKGSDS